MSTDTPTADDLARIRALCGDFTRSQEDELIDALDDDRDGTMFLAERIASSDKIDAPIAVLISCIRRGEHKGAADRRAANAERRRVSAGDALRRLYDAKLKDLAKTDWPTARRVEFAMDYAASELQRCNVGPLPPGGVVALEDALRAELGEPRFPD